MGVVKPYALQAGGRWFESSSAHLRIILPRLAFRLGGATSCYPIPLFIRGSDSRLRSPPDSPVAGVG